MKDTTLKHGFGLWAANCLKYDYAKEKCSFDLPHLVNIFQSLCFEVKHFDVNNGEAINPHRIRIVITCNQSGQRCILERDDGDSCSCLKHEYDSIPEGYILEYDSNEKKQLLPPVDDEKAAVIKPTMDYLFGLTKNTMNMEFIKHIQSSVMNKNKPSVDKGRSNGVQNTESGNYGDSKLSIDANVMDNCLHSTAATIHNSDSNLAIAVNCSDRKNIHLGPEITDSPRYRSLDSLTSKNITSNEIPEPGALVPKIIVDSIDDKISQSSVPYIYKEQENRKLYISSKTLNILKNSIEQLNEVVKQIDMNKTRSSSPGKISVKLKSASKNLKKFVCTSKVESTSSLKLSSCPNLKPGTNTAPGLIKPVKRTYQRTTSEEKTTTKLPTATKFVRSKIDTGIHSTLSKGIDPKKSKSLKNI